MLDEEQRAQLLLAVATGEPLDLADQARLDQLFAEDPAAAGDLAAVAEAFGALPAMGAGSWSWDTSAPPADLEDRVLAATAPATTTVTRRLWQRGQVGLVAACAAGLLALGGAGGWGLAQLDDRAPTGPAGTLGALEPVAFVAQPAGVEIDASVVAHTWGTETVFEVDGLEPGSTYQVVIVGPDGTEVPAGTFLATDGTVVCRMNAAVLRANAQAIAIRSSAGTDVLRAELPPVDVEAASDTL